jgi:hypothetical protein
MMDPLPCIKCGVRPERAVPVAILQDDGDHNQPYEATVFYSRGQYGSTVWDEFPGRDVIEINVCDKCLLEEADKGNILRVTVHTQRTRTAVPWRPEQVEELIIE